MDRPYLIGGAILVILVVFGLGAAFYAGVGPAPGGSSGDSLSEFPTETAPDGDGTADGQTADGESADLPPFTFAIDSIEECGTTCRDVTATLTNNQNETATGVTVYTRVFAGEDNTDEADLVWEGKNEVGTLEAGGSHTTSERIELSLQEARAIENENGWVSIVTTVQSDDRTVTFRDSEQVM